MLEILLFFIMLITILTLMTIEKKQYNTYLSPFILFSVPYIIIIIYQAIVISIYDWQPISANYLFYIFLYLVAFYMVGTFFVFFLEAFYRKYSKSKIVIKESFNQDTPKTRMKLVEVISIVSAIYLITFFVFNMKGLPAGLIVQEEFQTNYTSGINFYLRLFCMIGTIYFWGLLSKKNKVFFFLGLLCFIPNLLTFVKGIAFIMVLGSIIANMLIFKRELKMKTILSSVILGIVIFFSTYLFEIGIWNTNKLFEKDTYSFIFGKFNTYIVSGAQSFNINVNEVQNRFQDIPNPVYAPIINIFAKFGMVERIETISNVSTTLGFIPNYGFANVNTNTYIGTLILYCGTIFGLFINSLISIITYYFFYKAIRTNKTIKIIRYSLFASGLLLSWFDYYYMQMFWLYLIAFFFIIELVTKYKITR